MLAAGCSNLEHGEITSKKYEPESRYTVMVPVYTSQCSWNGKTTTCHQVLSTIIPTEQTDPECWRLNLRDGDETGHVCVSEKAWNRAREGAQW